MKLLDVDEIEVYDGVFNEALRIADDEFCNLIDYENKIFFYGKIIDDNAWLDGGCIDESKTYCLCPSCDRLFELSAQDKKSQTITCPHCGESGNLIDFRDKSQPLKDECEQDIAYMDTYEDGFVLRLFKGYADYSCRDYDDYTRLGCFPELRFFEYGREYWHDGEVKYYVNFQEDAEESCFSEVENLDDDAFWIMNTDEETEVLRDSPCLFDHKEGAADKPVMFYLTKSLSYKAFRTLRKYGFDCLANEMIYAADKFPDSSKISEVLGLDYNQIIADVGKDIHISELLAARQLYALNVRPTIQNIGLLMQMSQINEIQKFKLTEVNARKTLKYLRNQQNKQNKKNGANIGRDYVDYLSECSLLDFDMTDTRILYPTDLLLAHARTASLIEIKGNELTEVGVMNAYAKYSKLCSYDNGKLCVIMPQHCEDIIFEGKAQSHCVGKYIERVAKGEDVILFIRRSDKKEKPFYTLEIRPVMRKLDIVQCRGYENKDPSPEIRAEVDAFLTEYAAWFNTRRVLSEDRTIFQYYKAVRKIGGKYISGWDNRTEYIPGEVLETETDKNPDRVAVKGIHIASLEFAQKYGDMWDDVAILELEVDVKDIVIPDAKDQLRASRVKVVREVPFGEMGEWGAKHLKRVQIKKVVA